MTEPARSAGSTTLGTKIVVTSAVLVMLGSMMAWAVVDAPGGFKHLPGYQGAGKFTFVLALLVAVMAIAARSERAAGARRWLTAGLVVAALGCTVVGWLACADLANTLGNGYLSVDIGSGLYLVLGASVVMSCSVLIAALRPMARLAESPTAPTSVDLAG